MPITLDENLDPALYPLAWLIGSWRGEGAVALTDERGEQDGRRIEQEINAQPAEGGAMSWTMRTWVLDEAPPVPPTAAFAHAAPDSPGDTPSSAAQDAQAQPAHGPVERTLLVSETGTWTVGDPLPGQDLEAAASARPGTPEALVSHALEVELASDDGRRETFVGEVRGPRIQLATTQIQDETTTPRVLAARRMFGYVGGRLMWVLDRMVEGGEMTSWISAELDRA